MEMNHSLSIATIVLLLNIVYLALRVDSAEYYPPSPTPTSGNKILNPIDKCWRGRANWANDRQALANCAVGFGKDAIGGMKGRIYVVTSNLDDPVNPLPGTLRYGVIQTEPLWIVFAKSMVITLKNELMVNSYKTIDGRGANVEIAYGPCITIQHKSHVIIHGISIHDCKPGKATLVRDSPTHVGKRNGCDGDAISIFDSSHVWVDHCFLARGPDGLIDVVHASTAVTISNCYFTQHDKVMLLGHDDSFSADKAMRVTVAFNRFGAGCIERMPRVRFGYAHVANNKYEEWIMYAIGGSANPTIFSEGNYFAAPTNPGCKQVTKREVNGGWTSWKWRTYNDVFQNGAYFVPSGYGSCSPLYTATQRFTVANGAMVPALTADAGPLKCVVGKPC